MASKEEQPDTISRARFDQLLREYPAYIQSVSDARNSRSTASAVERRKKNIALAPGNLAGSPPGPKNPG